MTKRLLLNGSFAPSVVNFRGPLIRMLAARGYEMHVSVPDANPQERAEIEALGATLHDVPLERAGTSIMADIGYYRAMRRLVRQIAPSMVIGYTIKPNIWGSLAARAQGVPSASMVTGLGYTFIQRDRLKTKLISEVSRLLYRRATSANSAVIFQNPDDRADFLAARCLTDPAKARLVNGSGVDLAHFTPAPLPEAPVFLMVARLLVSKGVREYAQAAMQLLAERKDCRFLLAGNLDDTPDCIAEAELRRWQDAGVEYLGWTDDVRREMALASIYVLPSWREGTPRTVLEAMAMQRPVIATDAPGCRETVKQGETGLMVPVKDADALAQAMRRLADDAGLRTAMARAGRKYCEEKYAVETVNEALVAHLGL